jgi:hypothetical protein
MPHKNLTIEVPLKFNGFTIGSVTIHPDGTFEGRAGLDVVRDEMVENAQIGRLLAIDVNVEYLEKCSYTQSHTRDFCGNPMCRKV